MITGRTPVAAREVLRGSLQRALSCVTPAVLVDDTDAVESDFTLATPLMGTGGSGRLRISVRHLYSLVSDAARDARHRWQARTTAYYYTLDDADGREILAYHWHPIGRSHVTTPHLHLSAGAGSLRRELVKAHLETGFVTPVALLAVVLEQFDVRPRRADWVTVLEQARRALD